MKNKRNLSIILAVSIFAGILLLDLLTKGLIIPNLIPKVGDTVDVIPNFINFVYVKNFGAAWGMFAGRPIFLIIISIFVLGLLIAFYILRIRKTGEKSSVLFGISIGLIAGGCIGNLFDRIVFGYVRDFINFQFMDFPVFNFADIALTFGMIIILIYFVFYFSKEEGKPSFSKAEGEGQKSISLSNLDQLEPLTDEKEQDKNQNEGTQGEKVNGGKDER